MWDCLPLNQTDTTRGVLDRPNLENDTIHTQENDIWAELKITEKPIKQIKWQFIFKLGNEPKIKNNFGNERQNILREYANPNVMNAIYSSHDNIYEETVIIVNKYFTNNLKFIFTRLPLKDVIDRKLQI